MARPEKIAQVERVAEVLKDSRSVILSDFAGLDVEKISELRRLCREAGVEFLVVKNTLAKLGVKGTDAEGLSAFFEGPTAIAMSRESENEPAKILAKFAEEHEVPKFKAGFVDGKAFLVLTGALFCLGRICHGVVPFFGSSEFLSACSTRTRPEGSTNRF